ncbi:MAG: ATP-binding cassette domain-containing protein [Acidobacteriota bacterium]
MLSLRRVSKTYDDVTAVAAVDLAVAAGETVALIGPSGCGKSTLLRLIIGLVKPDEGRVEIDGEPLADDGATLRAQRRRMGYVIQSGGLFPHLTARRNVSLPADHLGWKEEKSGERIARLSALVHLPAATLDRFPTQLSGGQRQRVSLMRALMLDPDILLLDEPLGALDPMIRRDLQGELAEIFRTLRKTVVLVTHDLGEAGFFSQRLVLMNEGRIEQEGSIQELQEAPVTTFAHRFVAAQQAPEAKP